MSSPMNKPNDNPITTTHDVTVEVRKDGVAMLTIDVPGERMNILKETFFPAAQAALDEVEKNPAIKAAVIISGKSDSFIAGADINIIKSLQTVEEAAGVCRLGHSIMDRIAASKKPYVVAIHGVALGGGCELALACDIRVASENARFGQPEINLGIMPGGGGTQRLTHLVGEGRAMEIILTGDMIDAATALQFGLVNHVHPQSELEAETMKLAGKIAEKAPIALQLCKEAVKFAAKSNLDEGLRREVDLFAICFSTEDKEEGVAAFLEKRKPNFKGK